MALRNLHRRRCASANKHHRGLTHLESVLAGSETLGPEYPRDVQSDRNLLEGRIPTREYVHSYQNYYSSANDRPGIGAFADFFLALYPPAVIIGPLQQMRTSIKIGLCMVMGGGVV